MCEVKNIGDELWYENQSERWRRSQVVRRRSAKPLFSGSNPLAASISFFAANEFHFFHGIPLLCLAHSGYNVQKTFLYDRGCANKSL